MNKSKNVNGQPQSTQQHRSDRYYKRFSTYEHLVTMLFDTMTGSSSCAATHDHTFLKELGLQKGSFVVFDKGYLDYMQYYNWTLDGVYLVTWQKENDLYRSLEELTIEDHIHSAY